MDGYMDGWNNVADDEGVCCSEETGAFPGAEARWQVKGREGKRRGGRSAVQVGDVDLVIGDRGRECDRTWGGIWGEDFIKEIGCDVGI